MFYFKDANDGYYAAEPQVTFSSNWIEITEDEFIAAKPVISLPTPLEQINAIEIANPITHRNLRDLSMTVAQIASAVTGVDPMVNPAVQQIVALETQIAALRAQIES